MKALLRSLADNTNPCSAANALRRRRFALFRSLLDTLPKPVRLLDVGGSQEFWQAMGLVAGADLDITVLNLQPQVASLPHFHFVPGDARCMNMFADNSFDVAFSNSVIEHVGSFSDQANFAAEIRRVARCYFVQTPNRYFFLEPHYLVPFFQFLPLAVRAWLLAHFSLGWGQKAASLEAARNEAAATNLLGETRLRQLFPGSKLYREKLGPLVKSITVYGGWPRAN